jgi:chitin disaccharide deacetylase
VGTRLILNADDYGLDAAVDGAILALAERGSISSTSAMVLSPSWSEAARRLADAPLDKGLHLDLTSPFAETPFADKPLPRLIATAFARRLDRRAIRLTIDRQLQLFDGAMRHPPHFVDGHHHAHHLPVVRDALVEALEAHYGAGAKDVRLRSCVSRRWRGAKAALIAGTGAHAFERAVTPRGYRMNTDFVGGYDFSQSAGLTHLWRQWFATLQGDEPLAMCHVALPEPADSGGDTIRPARIREFNWLSSGEFRELCDEFSLTPMPWRRH